MNSNRQQQLLLVSLFLTLFLATDNVFAQSSGPGICSNNPESPSSCIGPNSNDTLFPYLHSGCQLNDSSTIDLCLPVLEFNPNTTLYEPVCQCVHYCPEFNCTDNDPCTIDDQIILSNFTCACTHTYQVGVGCPAPPTPAPPSCTPTEDCTGDITTGYCHPFGNSTFDYLVVHSGCNDCKRNTTDLCLLCDHSGNGTYYCQCEYVPIMGACGEDSDCNDNNLCTDDVCDLAGHCHNTPLSCGDGTLCTLDICDPQIGCMNPEIVCNDNSLCTTDSCDSVLGCLFTPVNCSDNFDCTLDSCSDTVGCIRIPQHEVCGEEGGFGNQCRRFLCDPQNSTGMADSQACVSNVTFCYDGIACTLDVCTSNFTCVYPPDNGQCSDGFSCTSDTCQPGNPQSNNITGCIYEKQDFLCDSPPYTCLMSLCDPQANNHNQLTGCYFSKNDSVCDDSAQCTLDVCNPFGDFDAPVSEVTGCSNIPDDNFCADSYTCTQNTCDPSNIDSDITTGCFQVNNNSLCDDNVACTDDMCLGIPAPDVDPISGCKSVASDNNCPTYGFPPDCFRYVCDEEFGCLMITDDSLCNDNLMCTLDICMPGTFTCVNTPMDYLCSDQYSCTTSFCSVDGADLNYWDQSTGCGVTTDTAPCFVGEQPLCNHQQCIGNYEDPLVYAMSNPYIFDNVTGCVIWGVQADCGSPTTCSIDNCTLYQGCVRVYDNSSTCTPIDACYTAYCDLDTGCQNTVINCVNPNACNSSYCDPELGCRYLETEDCCLQDSDCDDFTPPYGQCSIFTGCIDNQCMYNIQSCDDGLFCTDDSCNQTTGVCINTPVVCNDSPTPNTECNRFFCSELEQACIGVHYDPASGFCNDNLTCTEDSCYRDGDAVNLGYCDLVGDGCCHVPIDINCPILTCFHLGVCDTTQGCVYQPLDVTDYCTPEEIADPGGDCLMRICDPIGGICGSALIPGCCSDEDGVLCPESSDPCMENVCVDSTCVLTPANEGENCNDGFGCTTNDSCCGGVCRGIIVNCNDHDICTIDTCIETGNSTFICKNDCCEPNQRPAACDCCADKDCPSEHPICYSGIPYNLTLNNNSTRLCGGCANPLESVDLSNVNLTYVQAQSFDNCRTEGNSVCLRYTDFYYNDMMSSFHSSLLPSLSNGTVLYNCIPIARPLLLEFLRYDSNLLRPSANSPYTINFTVPLENRCNSSDPLRTCLSGARCIPAGNYSVYSEFNNSFVIFDNDICLDYIPAGWGCFTGGFNVSCTAPNICDRDTFSGQYICQGSGTSCTDDSQCRIGGTALYHQHCSVFGGGGVCVASDPFFVNVTSPVNCFSFPQNYGCSSDERCVFYDNDTNAACLKCNRAGMMDFSDVSTNHVSKYDLTCTTDNDCCLGERCYEDPLMGNLKYCLFAAKLGDPCASTLPLPPPNFVPRTSSHSLDDPHLPFFATCQDDNICYQKPGAVVAYCVECVSDADCETGACNQLGVCEPSCTCDGDCDDDIDCTIECCDVETHKCHYTISTSTNCSGMGYCADDFDCIGSQPIALSSINNNAIFPIPLTYAYLNTAGVGHCDRKTKRCSTYCGDGIVNGLLEECDNGLAMNSDSLYNSTCLSTCRRPFCGDGFLQSPEECDNGFNLNSDSGSSNCTIGCTVYFADEEETQPNILSPSTPISPTSSSNIANIVTGSPSTTTATNSNQGLDKIGAEIAEKNKNEFIPLWIVIGIVGGLLVLGLCFWLFLGGAYRSRDYNNYRGNMSQPPANYPQLYSSSSSHVNLGKFQ